MSMENRLWEPTEKQLAPQEKILMIKQSADETVKKFLEKDPATIKAEDLITATTEVDSLRFTAENSGEEDLPKYLDNKLEELRRHKNSGLKDKLDNMGPLGNIPTKNIPGKRKIGTHGRTH